VYHEVPWRFHVRLLDDGRVVDDQSPFSAACDNAEPTEAAYVNGADPEAQAWRTTYLDKCEVSLAARSVELSPGVSALLVTQQTGQEDVYQLHWLFLEHRGKLETLWSSTALRSRERSENDASPRRPKPSVRDKSRHLQDA